MADWMFACDVCGKRYPAHEELRGTGNAGRREGRRRAKEDGWDSDEAANSDWCPDHVPYLGIGIDQKRCAACAAYPSLPCAVHRDSERPIRAAEEANDD